MDNSKSILLGNGFDVQLGGDDYLNRWIMTRLIIKARMGKYDCLFRDSNAKVDTIKGDEIVCLLEHMITIAQDAINGRYDKPVDAFNNKYMMLFCNLREAIKTIFLQALNKLVSSIGY